MRIDVRDLSFAYPGRPVFQKVNLSLQEDSVMALLGVNGAGKSTLLKCIGRIITKYQGDVFFDDVSTRDYSTVDMARHVAYVPQQLAFDGGIVFDTVLTGRRPYIQLGVRKHDLQVVEEVLEQLQIADLAMRPIHELSGGEKQKVAIARALVQQPSLLLLDEPTSNLDIKTQVEVTNLVRTIAKASSMAVIAILHDINLASQLADHFVWLKDGNVFANGGKETLTAENVKTVYGVDASVEWVRDKKIIVF